MKALEEKGSIVHWAEAKEGVQPLADPPAWVVPLDEKPGKALEEEKEKLKTAQDSRKQKLESLRGEKEFKSVTSVLKVDAEKKEREDRVFDEPEAGSPWGGKELGTFAHLLLEKGLDWDKATLEKAAAFYRDNSGISQEQASLAVEWVEKTLQSKIIQQARGSKKVFRELPLTVQQADGSYLNAVLDLAFLDGDQWILVDYKTDQKKEPGMEKYQKQLGIYSELLEKMTGKKVKSRNLHFLRSQETVTF